MNGTVKKILILVLGVVILTLVIWMYFGLTIEWGLFKFLAFNKREKEILKTYDADSRQNEIVFYGASNFRLWKEMDEDMKPFIVQNHGFGGSTDQDLMKRADRLLYPYHPAIVVFQTGSNDCAQIKGTDDEIYNQVIERKLKMFETFHERMPDAKFVVISGILMSGRTEYEGIIKRVNQRLRELADQTDYLYFVDAEEMTLDEEGNPIPDMFISDGIHLTHDSRVRWANEYIKPVLETILANDPELTYLKQ